MKINSDESIKAASAVFRAYGSWTAARAAAHRDENGVLVIPVPQDAEPQAPRLERKAG
jgi:hypothetical protein